MSRLAWLAVSILLGLARAEQGVVVRGPLDFEPAPSIARLDPRQLAGSEAVWVWSPVSSPRRLTPRDLATRHTGTAPPVRPLQVRISKARESWSHDLRLIAAPAEMWEEIPEPLLPSWPVPRSGRLAIPVDGSRPWRLRVAGAEGGSFWLDLPPGARVAGLAASRASGARSRIVGAEGAVGTGGAGGQTVGGVSVRVLEGGLGRLGSGKGWAWVLGDAEGRILLPGLPDRSELSWLATTSGHPPRLLVSTPSRLPAEIALAAGAEVRGQIVDPQGKPVRGAEVVVETWGSRQAPVSFRVREETDAGGAFRARAVPPGKAVLLISRPGWAPTRRPLEVPTEGMDAGPIALSRGGALAVRAVDDLGVPVAGATIEAGLGARGETGRDGTLLLEALPLGEPLRLKARASRHLPAERSVVLPVEGEVEIRLAQGFQVTGRFVSISGSALGDPTLRVIHGRSFDLEPLAADGSFSLALRPDESYELRFASPLSATLLVPLIAGAPGEARDLGELRAPAGGGATGRLVDGATGEPLPGGRIWAPRPSAQGPILAWMGRDLLETTSGPDGAFRLTGLPAGPAMLRIEVAGFAHLRQIAVIPEEGDASLGDIPLPAGTALRVVTGARSEGATATVDPGRDGLPFDRLLAPVLDGEARIEAVPPGSARLSVTRGAALLCEKTVSVPAGVEELTVECPAEGFTVRGTVTLGDYPAGAGALVWQTEAGPIPEGIMTYRSPGGLTQQQVYSANAAPVAAPVDARGAFATTELRSGPWEVTFQAEGGGSTEPLRVVLEAAPEQMVELRFPGRSLAGRVVDESGEGVEGARVRELEGGASTRSGPGGAFRLDGLRAKTYSLSAWKDDLESNPLAVHLEEDRRSEGIVLTLREGGREPEVQIRVAGRDGAPAAGAFVFVEVPGRGARVLTAGADGVAELRLDPPFPATLRAAARLGDAWALGAWVPLEEARKGMALAADARAASGTLRVEAGNASGLLKITAPGGWNLTALLSTLGFPPLLEAGSALRLAGLPPGLYELEAGGETRPALVREGSEEHVGFGRK